MDNNSITKLITNINHNLIIDISSIIYIKQIINAIINRISKDYLKNLSLKEISLLVFDDQQQLFIEKFKEKILLLDDYNLSFGSKSEFVRFLLLEDDIENILSILGYKQISTFFLFYIILCCEMFIETLIKKHKAKIITNESIIELIYENRNFRIMMLKIDETWDTIFENSIIELESTKQYIGKSKITSKESTFII